MIELARQRQSAEEFLAPAPSSTQRRRRWPTWLKASLVPVLGLIATAIGGTVKTAREEYDADRRKDLAVLESAVEATNAARQAERDEFTANLGHPDAAAWTQGADLATVAARQKAVNSLIPTLGSVDDEVARRCGELLAERVEMVAFSNSETVAREMNTLVDRTHREALDRLADLIRANNVSKWEWATSFGRHQASPDESGSAELCRD
jgi:hypothetical protein